MRVAAEITDALRQRVAATKGYQLLQGKDLVEVKLVFACPDAAPACMSQAGKSLGADKVIFGNVKKRRQRLPGDAQAARRQPRRRRELHGRDRPAKHADAAGLRSSAPGWLAKLSGKGGGSIQVRANFPGAAVSLDGTQVGDDGRQPRRHPRRRAGPPRGDRREERLHHDQAGVHAGCRAEPAAQPDAVAGVGGGAHAGRSARARNRRRQASPRAARGRHWPGPASGSRSSAPWRRPGWR